MDSEARGRASIIDEFERQAHLQAQRTAVEHGDARCTYGALHARVHEIAGFLLDQGVRPGSYVGVYLRPCIDLIASVLAILRVGAAYVPVDRKAPPQRLSFVVQDARPHVVLTDDEELKSDIYQLLPERLSSDAARPDFPAVSRDAEAYVIYTSGSTGHPKGVICTHHNVLRLLESTEHQFAFSADDRWTLFHSIAFDFSVWEIFACLLYGGTLVIVDAALARDSVRFAETLIDSRITFLNQTPSALYNLVRVARLRKIDCFAGVRCVVLGGERLQVDKLQHWFDREIAARPRLINMYGITETTVHVTFREILETDLLAGADVSPIGVPIRDLTVHLLKDDLSPVDDGAPGEICVAGGGVAKGYLNRPELTAQRFVPNPFDDGASPTMYRSGDLAVRLPSGELSYIGRMDRQVKIRGYRIELGEIESNLLRLDGVAGAHVSAERSEDGDNRLVAYVIANGQAPADARVLREALARVLPAHMVPGQLHFVPELPLTINGKLDERALAAMVTASAAPSGLASLPPPADAIERKVKAIWLETLKLPDVSVRASLYDVGAHSLAIVSIAMRLLEEFAIEIPVSDLQGDACIASIAGQIRNALTDTRRRSHGS